MSNENQSNAVQDEGYDISDLLTDETREVEGVWRDLPKGAAVKVGRWQNDEFQKMMRRKFKSNRVMLEQDDDISDKVSLDILVEVMAHTVLKDVKNLKFGGSVIEQYTPAIGIKLLKVKDFRDKVRAFAEDVNVYRVKQEDDAVKS